MKKTILVMLTLIIIVILSASIVQADPPTKFDSEGVEIEWDKGYRDSCTRIQDGTLLRTDDVVITTGFDEWGYNYQAHIFNGGFCDSYRDAAWCQAYKDIDLMMKWNDAWIANTSCDEDDLLDRHHGYDSYIGSGAWLTNHQSGSYVDEFTSDSCNWNYFVKIVAASDDANDVGGTWFNVDGVEIGPSIWGEFAIIQEVENDPCAGVNGAHYISPDHAGFGGW